MKWNEIMKKKNENNKNKIVMKNEEKWRKIMCV